MSKETARQEAKPQTIETTSTILIDSVALGKKDSLHILHVDDDVCFLEVSKQILSMENNFEIDTALSVDEAFQKMEKQTFDAIVSDFEMPLKNGLEFLRELREQRNEIPFILFTGKGREEVAVEALNLGADRYINKNGSPETVYCELAHAINKTAEQRKSRKLLAASESKYRMLVEKSLQGILITLADPLRLVFANDTMGKILGYSSQELMSLSPERIMGLVYHEDRAVFFKRLENRFRGEPAESCLEFRAVRKDGSIIWLDALSSRVEYDGQPAVQGVFLDVNERKKAEEVLRRSEEKYRELANCLPEIVFETDMNGQLVFANERAAEISGYSLSEIEKGLSILQFIAPEDRERGTKIIQRLLAGGGCVPAEYTFVRKDGTTFHALITATPRISENKVAGLRGLVIDITERKHTEETLRQSEERFRQLFSSMPSGVAIYEAIDNGKDFVFKDFNAAAEKIEKTSKADVLGKRVTQTFPGVKDFGVFEVFQRVWRTGQSEYFPAALYKDDKDQGTWRESWIYKLPNGNIISIYNDITQRKRAEENLCQSEEKYRGLFESTQDGIVISDAEGVVLSANQAAAIMLGYKNAEELVNVPAETLYGDPQDRQVLFELLAKKGTVKDYEVKLKRKDGKTFDVRVTVDLQRDLQGNVLRSESIFRDITERKKAKEALRLSEEKHRAISSITADCVFSCVKADKEDFAIDWMVGATEKIFGYSTKEIMDEGSWRFTVQPQDLPTFEEKVNGLKPGQSSVCELRINHKDGSTRWIKVSSQVTKDSSNPTNHRLFGACRDITERKRTEELLKDSVAKYRDFAESLPEIVFEIDAKGTLVFVNQKAAQITGYSQDEFGNNFNFIRLVVPDEREKAIAHIKRLLSGENVGSTEYNLVKKDGAVFPVMIWATPRIVQNKVAGLRGIVVDISEHKKAEESLRETKEYFDNLLNYANAPIIVWDNKKKITLFNNAFEVFTGYSKESMLRENIEVLFPASHKTRILETIGKATRGEKWQSVEVPILCKDEQTRIALWNSANVTDKDGNIVATIAQGQDITERKKMEDALRQDQDMLEAITENLGAGFVTISKDYRVLYANRFVKNNVGNVEGKPCYATLNTLDHVCPDCGVKKVFEDGAAKDSHEYSQVGIDGKPYYVELIATPLKDKDGNVTAALEFVIDIAEKKRMQQTLQANEAKFRAISDSAIDAIFMFNEEDRITYWNPAAERIFGYTEKEIVGEKVGATIVPPRFHKDHLKLTSELGKVENMKKNAGEILEFPAFRKDGTEFSMELSMAPLQLEGKLYIVAIARDITDRKKAEGALDRTMNELVLVNEKLGVVGSLTRHDVRNKLSAVTGYAYLLKKKHADQADVLDGVSKMEQAVKEIAAIFDFAKMYEQLGVEELKYINAEKALNGAIALFSGSSSLEFINDCHGLSLLADSLLTQLFYNLIDNSLKHGEKVTKIRVHYEKADQDELIVVYEDDGVGVSAENKPKLFKEGFSTSGTSGYGLFLMRKMMSVYGWTIQENGEPGKGAKFTITIPRINQNGKENFQIA